MKLYEAMLKGARMGPQVRGTWSDGNGGTCAMGAVMLGCGLMIGSHTWYDSHKAIHSQFPELKNKTLCPVSDCKTHVNDRNMTLTEVIMHLNDFHVRSRQRIAEWLSGSRITAPKAAEKVLIGA